MDKFTLISLTIVAAIVVSVVLALAVKILRLPCEVWTVLFIAFVMVDISCWCLGKLIDRLKL